MPLCSKVVIHSFIHCTHSNLVLVWSPVRASAGNTGLHCAFKSAVTPGVGGGELPLGGGGQGSFLWRGGVGAGKKGVEIRERKVLSCRMGVRDTMSEGTI